MIPARIGRNLKKSFIVPDGIYDGFWQDYFCWLYKPGTTEIFHRFDTATKCSFKRGEKVRVVVNVTSFIIYEKLKS